MERVKNEGSIAVLPKAVDEHETDAQVDAEAQVDAQTQAEEMTDKVERNEVVVHFALVSSVEVDANDENEVSPVVGVGIRYFVVTKNYLSQFRDNAVMGSNYGVAVDGMLERAFVGMVKVRAFLSAKAWIQATVRRTEIIIRPFKGESRIVARTRFVVRS